MRTRSITYGGWFLVALALHGGLLLAWSRMIDLRPEVAMSPGESIEMTLVESTPTLEELPAESALPPEPEPPPVLPPEPLPPESKPELEPEPVPAEEPPMASPAPAATPSPLKPISTPRPTQSKPTAPRRAPASASANAGEPGPAGVRTTAKPNYLRNPPPSYPAASRAAGEEGVTILDVEVTEQGRAASVRLHQSSGHPRLDEAAISAVRRWRFSPARIGGIPVSSKVKVPVRFQLR